MGEVISAYYWPWWLGAAALAATAVLHLFLLKRPMAVSSSWARVIHWIGHREEEKEEEEVLSDAAALEAALLQATLARFGQDQAPAADTPADAPAPASGAVAMVPSRVHLTFLVSVLVGGLIAALASGNFQLRMDMGGDFERLIASGWAGWSVLLIGGTMVGFGTRMAGGCTSGHGLSGCGSLQPGSWAATASFFGMGVIVSMLLSHLWR